MKSRVPNYFPILRRSYKTEEDLGLVINRSSRYVRQRLNDPGRYRFTAREIMLICQDIRIEPSLVFYEYQKIHDRR